MSNAVAYENQENQESKVQFNDIVYSKSNKQFRICKADAITKKNMIWADMYNKNSIGMAKQVIALDKDDIEIAFRQVDGEYISLNTEKFKMINYMPKII